MTVIKQFWDWLSEDVSDRNELKKPAVMIRTATLIMCFYNIIQIFVFIVVQHQKLALVSAGFSFLYYYALKMTYRNQTRQSYYFTMILMLVWVVTFVYLLGWNVGTQHFIFVLIVFCFITGHTAAKFKYALCAFFCLVRLGLYFYTRAYLPVYEIDHSVDWVMQVSNTVAICFLQTVLIALFASDQLMQEGKLMEYNREITHLASVDPLTGLMNRRSAQDEVARMVSRSREEIPFVTVVMGDIDFFKTVNDTYGHEMGDTVLKTLANCFKEELKDVGIIARWGGEEFLFIFPGLNGDQVFDFMEKLRRKIKHIKFQNGDTEFKVSMTFGVQEHDFRDTIDETIDSADRKLYSGKARGRDVVIY